MEVRNFSFPHLTFLSLFDHPGSNVDARNMLGMRRKLAGDETRTAGNVEDIISG